MIFELVHAEGGIAERLAARKFPFPVVYGPEQHKRGSFDTSIVIARDPDGTDTIGAAPGFKQNPRKIAARHLACVATVFAKSSADGAHVGDHESLAEQIVDALVTALENWADESKSPVAFGEMRYLRAEEIGEGDANFQVWPGRAYRMKFTVGRGVFARTFAGEAQPTAAILAFRNRTEARYTGQPDSVPTIGCGEP